MSHFVVTVVIEPGTGLVPAFDGSNIPGIIEQIMAPFQENNMDDCPKEFLEFNDVEDEMLKEYEEGVQEKVVMPDGRLLFPWDEEFALKHTEEELEKDPLLRFQRKKEVPADLVKRLVPFKETYSTFEEFAKEWHGREKRDATHNRYGYWENPNSKWDWYEIGGRWAGYFQLKNGAVGVQGKQYNHFNEYRKSDKADVCFKKDIDFERIRNEAGEEAAKNWELVHKQWEGLPELESWDAIRERHGREGVDDARKEYWAQPRVAACKTKEIQDQIGWMEDCERYQVSKEQFVQRAREASGVSFAVVKDGKWHENGRMGWFGSVSDEKDPETWNSMYSKMIDDLPEDSILVAIDCHI